MKVRPPKEYHELSKQAKKRIDDYIIEAATKAALKQEEHDCRLILDIYMKMVCCVLHDAFGFGEKRLNYFIGNHKRLITHQNRLVEKGVQLEYLNKRMDEIFKKNGFPQQFIDNIIGEVELIEQPQEEE